MKVLKVLKKGIALGVILIAVVLTACGESGESSDPMKSPPPPAVDEPSEISLLWADTVRPLLDADLWNSQNNYDAAHVLMIPLHWAYTVNDEPEFVDDLERYFSKYAAEGSLADETNQLRKLQYFYLHSQYLKLKVNTKRTLSSDDQVILTHLLDEVEYQWLEREARTYGYPAFPGGQKERLAFKMDTFATDPEYARAIFDEELYLLTIAADLMVVLDESEQPQYLSEIQQAAYYLFVQEGLDVGDGWLFQPGVWSHYRDYIYSGHTELVPGLEPSILEDIAMDSSHFHRMPLWVKSLRDSYSDDDREYAYYGELLQRINWQLNNVILVPASSEFNAPRLHNFTDGWNGIYRYQYDTVGDNLGYEPYGISGVLPYSWYAFISSDVLLQEYSSLEFPLSQETIDVYVGPNTTRERHPLMQWPDYFENGFAQLNILLAIEIM